MQCGSAKFRHLTPTANPGSSTALPAALLRGGTSGTGRPAGDARLQTPVRCYALPRPRDPTDLVAGATVGLVRNLTSARCPAVAA